MTPFLVWLESTALSIWVRESPSVFAFPIILSCHTIGMGIVAGTSAAMDLRILGAAPGVPLSEMRRFFTFLWFGFWLNAASGVVLLIGYPTKALTNPVFYTKLLFVVFGVITQRWIERSVLTEAAAAGGVTRAGRRAAWLSLFCWATVITAGRLLAYTYNTLMST